jgi:hypothetical protein
MKELGEIAAGEDEAKPTPHLKVGLIRERERGPTLHLKVGLIRERKRGPTLHLKVALVLICSRMHAASAPIRRGDALDTDPSVRVLLRLPKHAVQRSPSPGRCA